MRQHAEKGFA
jgi:hypothetical protein